jgi:hypothetical protein
MKNPVGLLVILAVLLGSCTAMAGDLSHWPASAPAVAAILAMKVANDRLRLLSWPMEFLLASAVVLIVANLARLYLIGPVM